MQNLTVRLEMVFGQVKAAASGSSEVRVIDVGSDHGYLALRCLEDGLAETAVCTEIHKALPEDLRMRLLKPDLVNVPKFMLLTA